MELLKLDQYEEYETFMASHPQSCFTQSLKWQKVKSDWGIDGVLSRNKDGEIVGAMTVLVKKIPLFGDTLLYSPRGPVCDLHDKEILTDLKNGIDVLAKKHNAYLFKMDPDVLAQDQEFATIMHALGFRHLESGNGFETIQAKFNYRLYLNGRTEDEIFASITQKTRYNIRVAIKHDVQVKIVGKEYLDDFMKLMRTTGERDGFSVRPKAYFERMLGSLGDSVRMYMAFYQDKPVSGAITTNFAGKTCYVYGASDNNHRNVMPNYLVQWEMIKWAIQTNCIVYDFQGVSGNLSENDPLYGLYRFKKGFNGNLDELAGEFDLVYKPTKEKLIDKAIDINEKIRKLKRKIIK